MNNAMEVTSPDAVGGGRMEPSATFGRGHKHSSSLLGPEPRSHPLPELATLAPTSPSFAGRGDVSGLFWSLVYRMGHTTSAFSEMYDLEIEVVRSVKAFYGCATQ